MNRRLFSKTFDLWRKTHSHHLSIFDQKGAALVTSILFATVIGVGALVATQSMFQDIERGERYTQTREAFYIAEAGIQKAMNYLNYDENGDSPGDAGNGFTAVLANFESDNSEVFNNFEFGGGTYTVFVKDNDDNDDDKATDADNTIILSSTGIKDGRNITIEAVIQNGIYKNKHAITSGGNFTIEGDPTVQGNLGSIHSNSDVVGLSSNVEQGIFAVGECSDGCDSGAISEEIPLANPSDFSSYANFILTSFGSINDADGEHVDIEENQLENWTFSNSGWELEGCSGHGMFYSETDVSLAGDTGECGEKIVEEVDPEIAGARECYKLAFYANNSLNKKGIEIDGVFYKGYLDRHILHRIFRSDLAEVGWARTNLERYSNWDGKSIYKVPNSGLYSKRNQLFKMAQGWNWFSYCAARYTSNNPNLPVEKYKNRQRFKYWQGYKISVPQSKSNFRWRVHQWPGGLKKQMAAASYFDSYVRGSFQIGCIETQRKCLDLKNFADGHRDSNYRPSQRHQEMYAVSGCDEALELSCRIKPNKKSLFNDFELNHTLAFGNKNNDGLGHMYTVCKGEKGYMVPGCKGYRETNIEDFIKPCNTRGDKNNNKWKKYVRNRNKLEYWSRGRTAINGVCGFAPRWHENQKECDWPPTVNMCQRLAYDDPKVLALIEEEAKYQEELQEQLNNEQENDYDSDEAGYRALSGKPLSITLVAEGDILVSGNANIQNFKNDNHPEEIQNLLFVAAGDIDFDGKVPEPIDGIVTAGEQVSLTADAELSGYVIASDVYEDSSMVTESNIIENFTVTYNDLKNPFLNDQTKILSWKQ
jgi:hypothetical protein